MGHVVGPNFASPNHRGSRSLFGVLSSFLASFFGSFVAIIRKYGLKGLAALGFAALFAFSPLTLLYWYNEFRPTKVVEAVFRGSVIVKSARYQDEQEQDEPGETALLKVVCDTKVSDTVHPLLLDDDPRRERAGLQETAFVRREQVYLRPADFDPPLPFALLGRPPISIWVPAGEYEVLVVHEAPRRNSYVDPKAHAFPLLSEFRRCSLENKQTTVCRVLLSHYDWGFDPPIELPEADGTTSDRPPTEAELAPFLSACEQIESLPTFGGRLLALAEPTVRHDDEHRRCTIDYADLRSVPREWTREQAATVRNWLPPHATTARARLSAIVDSLVWRERFEGWSCYLAAGVAGLVFTRWGALAMLEPWRRGDSFRESLGLFVKIFILASLAWFLFHLVADRSGCRLPLQFPSH